MNDIVTPPPCSLCLADGSRNHYGEDCRTQGKWRRAGTARSLHLVLVPLRHPVQPEVGGEREGKGGGVERGAEDVAGLDGTGCQVVPGRGQVVSRRARRPQAVRPSEGDLEEDILPGFLTEQVEVRQVAIGGPAGVQPPGPGFVAVMQVDPPGADLGAQTEPGEVALRQVAQ